MINTLVRVARNIESAGLSQGQLVLITDVLDEGLVEVEFREAIAAIPHDAVVLPP